MTALDQYERLEAAGLWRAEPDAQLLNVYIAMGEASLTITDAGSRPLAHWSLAAIERRNPGKRPAVFYPSGDPGQTIELGQDASPLIEALEKVRTAIGRKRPHPGRLRLLSFAGSCVAVIAFATLWLPGAVRDHVANALPDVTRTEIGAALRDKIERVTGPACRNGEGRQSLAELTAVLPDRMRPNQIEVMRSGVATAVALPGGTIMTGRALVEDFDNADVFAGFVVAEALRAAEQDPLRALLDDASVVEALRLLTSGTAPDTALIRHAQTMLIAPRSMPKDEVLLAGFRDAGLRTTPYAYAVDVTGETVLGLIEADPYAGATPPPLLSDAAWLRLQSICGG